MLPIRLQIDKSFFLPEERDGYLVSSKMKQVWAVELDLLNEFAHFCSNHNLRWFVHAGTMLGAIRHQGFIPWDDDIDVLMPRDDYEQLCRVAPLEFKHPYFFQNENTDRFFARNFSKLRNSETTAILEYDRHMNFPFNQGVFIDIFPMDNVPADLEERNAYYRSLTLLDNKSWQWRNLIHYYSPKRGKGVAKRISYSLKHFYHKYLSNKGYTYYMHKHHELVTKYNYEATGWIGESIVSPLGRQLWKSDWVEDTILVPFEMLQVPVPCHYEECLTASYGDWKTPKHVSTLHGDVFFDTEKPYYVYLKTPKDV